MLLVSGLLNCILIWLINGNDFACAFAPKHNFATTVVSWNNNILSYFQFIVNSEVDDV